MRRSKIIIFTTIALLLFAAAFAVGTGKTQVALAQTTAGNVVYNLYATDGYIELPDGLPLYIYGFVGGRATGAANWSYQTSCIPGRGTCTGSIVQTLNGPPPAPTGGPWTGIDATLAGNAQLPAPLIYAGVNDIVEIRLKNLGVKAQPGAPNDPHSIHLHGLDVDAANDGVPETSLGAVPANLCADGTTAPANGVCRRNQGGPALGAGNVIVYMFSPDKEGTYMYHCHQEADIHVQMGMYGALVVYDELSAGATQGPGGSGTIFGKSYDKDYVMLVTEFDVQGHQAEEGTYRASAWQPPVYNWAHYEPEYWMINGISFPNTIHAPWPSGFSFGQWLTAHPGYETLYTGSVSTLPGLGNTWGTPGDKVLLRVINLGFETHPLHMHGYHGKILGSDAREWTWTEAPFNEGLEKNTLTIGSGETYEWLVDFGQQSFASTYPAGGGGLNGDFVGGTQSRYDPVTFLPLSNTSGGLPIPDFGLLGGPEYIAGPTVAGIVDILGLGLGLVPPTLAPIDVTVPGLVPAQSQYFPFHNHDDYKATNNGVYPGGMFTFLVPIP